MLTHFCVSKLLCRNTTLLLAWFQIHDFTVAGAKREAVINHTGSLSLETKRVWKCLRSSDNSINSVTGFLDFFLTFWTEQNVP
jgi:hypothetical protein